MSFWLVSRCAFRLWYSPPLTLVHLWWDVSRPWNGGDVTPLVLSCLHALRLCFLLTIFVRPNCFYCLPDSLRTLPLSRYLAALVSTCLIMLTFLFRICFSCLCCLCLLSSLLDTYTRESSLQILTQTCLLLTKYYTKLLSAHYQVADASPYCIMNCSVCTCISSCRWDPIRIRLGLLCNLRTLNNL
jgi:hypothetical protein